MTDTLVNDTVDNNDIPMESQEAPVVNEQPVATEPTSFIDTIAEDLRGQSNLKDFKDVNDLAKSYVNLQRMVGNSVRIPPADASAEAKAEFYAKIKDMDGVIIKPTDPSNYDEFYKKLGRPDTKDDYQIADETLEVLKSVAPDVEGEINQFKEVAYDIGLNNDQVKKLIDMRADVLKEFKENYEMKKEESLATLKKMWGDDYDNRLDGAKHVAKMYKEKYGDAVNELINGPAGNNPVFLNMLSELGSLYKEKGHEGLQKVSFGVTPEMAINKIQEKKADVGFMKAYNDDMHPGHKLAVKELSELYKIAYS